MAKKKEGAGQGIIITLVFFVITTLVLGAVAYYGYADQEELRNQAKAAKEKLDKQQIIAENQEARKLVARIAMGTEDPEDLKTLQGLSNRKEAILDEYNLIKAKGGDKFRWDSIAGGDTPGPAPSKTMLNLLDEAAQKLRNAETAAQTAKNNETAARNNAQKAQDAQKASEKQFNDSIADLTKRVNKLNSDYDQKFKEYIDGLATQSKDLNGNVLVQKDNADEFQRNLENTAKKLADAKKLIERLQQDQKFEGPDLIKSDFKKGSILRVDNDFVVIDIGSQKFLRPNTTFAILPAGVAWRDAKEKEKLIKGKIEVIDILTGTTARAKIIDQAEPIRNPISAKDEIYNPAWSANQQIHVAFSGAIDLHGSGYDSNEEFIRMLESMGVIIDSYLDLKTQEIKGKGIDLNTKFLIIGPDAKLLNGMDVISDKDPRSAVITAINSKMGAMKARAKEAGVQVVEARKFLNFMGVRIPERVQPLDYGYLRPPEGAPQSEEKKLDK